MRSSTMLTAVLLAAGYALAGEDAVPQLSPEIASLKIDVDGDGSCTYGDKLALQIWVDRYGGDLNAILEQGKQLSDGGIDVSALFGIKPRAEPAQGTAAPEEQPGAGQAGIEAVTDYT